MLKPIDSQTTTQLHDYLAQNRPTYLDLLHQMVAINSFTANPIGVNKLGNLTNQAFAELGFTGHAIQATNRAYGQHRVLTRPGSSRRQVALVSHLDTVFPQDEERRHNFAWRPEGDRIYGPGTIDIKGGTVVMYMMLAALQQVTPHLYDDINWLILLNAAEETIAEDFRGLCLEHLEPDNALACLVFEAGKMRHDNEYSVVVARKGMALYRIEVEGRAAHAGSSHPKGANAITQLAQLIQKIANLTDYDNNLTFNIGTIAGGTVINRVPHYAVATGEMRAFSAAVYDRGLANLLALDGQPTVYSPQDNFPCRVKIKLLNQTPPWPRNPATDRLFGLWQEAGHRLGLEAIPEHRGGLSDGNPLWPHVPTIDGLGPVGRNAHCSEQSTDGQKEQEYVLASSLVPKALLNTMAVLKLIETGE